MTTQGIQQSDTTWRWWALGFVLTGYLVVFAGVTNMNVALPAAQAELGFTDAARQWVITLYALCFGALMVPGGRLGDVIGLQRCFTVGITGFAAASLIGGLAGNTQVLLAGRALQGATGALVAATGLALLSVMFPDGPARARAFGALGTVMGLGTAGSFLLAGALVDGLSWRWTLLINVPVAAVVVAGLARAVPPGTTAPAAPRGPRLDLIGAALITAALALLVTGFDRAGVLGWAAPATVTLLVAGLVLALLLIGWLRRAENPLIPRRYSPTGSGRPHSPRCSSRESACSPACSSSRSTCKTSSATPPWPPAWRSYRLGLAPWSSPTFSAHPGPPASRPARPSSSVC